MRNRSPLLFACLIAAALGGWLLLRADDRKGLPQTAQTGVVASQAAQAGKASTHQAGGGEKLQSAPRAGDISIIEVKVSAGGRPRPGAEVRVYERAAPGPFQGGADWRLLGAVIAGPDGKARFAGRPGRFYSSARAPGFAVARRLFARPIGDAATQVDLQLEPGTPLLGRTVAQGGAEPVPFATIALSPQASGGERRQSSEGPPQERLIANSDARGVFRIDGLAQGRYRAEATAAGFVAAVERSFALPRASELVLELPPASFIEGFVVSADARPAPGALVTVQGDAVRGEGAEATTSAGGAFALEVAPGTFRLVARLGNEAGAVGPIAVAAGRTARGVVIQLGAAAAISGWVTATATGEPIEGAQVAVRPLLASGDFGRGQADPSGAFTVEGLAPGTYAVEVTAQGYTPLVRRGITVHAGQRFPLKLSLQGGGTVRGTVRDRAGRAVPRALVSVFRAASATPVRTDDAGEFRITGLPAGRVHLSAAREGSPFGERQAIDVGPGEEARADFTLAGEGVLQGKVSTRAGRAPPAITVRVYADGTVAPRNVDFGLEAGVEGGRYRLSLPSGRYTVCALRVGSERRCRRSGDAATVEEGGTASLDLVLQDDDASSGRDDDRDGDVRPRVTGIVLEPTGTPSPGATVSSGERGGTAICDADGRFSLAVAQADRRSTTLRAWNGARGGEAVVESGGGEVTLQLSPGASLRGRLLASAVPESFFLRVAPSGSFAWPWGVVRTYEFAGERFELHELPPSSVRLRVRTSDGRIGEAVVDLAAGSTAEIDVRLLDAGSIAGRALDREGRPLARVTARVDEQRSVGGDDEQTRPDGRFEIAGLSAGDNTLRLRDGAGRALVRRVTVAEGQRLDLGDLVLESPKIGPGTIGVVIASRKGAVLLGRVLLDGPAMRAGLLEGDVVLAVDGIPIKGQQDARQRILGPPGTPVALTIRRGPAEAAVSVVRAP